MCKKVLAVLLAAVMLLSMITVSAAAADTGFSDTANHWAESAIDRWSGYGVVSGYNGAFRPNNNMTRGEFAQTMSTLLGLTEKAENKFSDLKGTEWYADAVLKCRAAGIMVGTNGKSNATSKISRQEAFVMLGRALGIQPAASTAALGKFGDAKGIANYAKPMLAAMVDAGYIAGVGGNSMKPVANINRASVMQILNATITTYANEPGTYAAEGDGIVVVNTEDTVVITGEADGIVVSQGAEGANVIIDANVDGNVKVDAPDSTVSLTNASVDAITVTESAENAEIIVNAGSSVETVTTSADGVAINGSGEVKEVQVEDGDKVEVNTPGTTVTVDSDAGTVTVDGAAVPPGQSVTTEGSGTGYEETTGGGSTAPKYPNPVLAIHGDASGAYESVVTGGSVSTTNSGDTYTVTLSATEVKYHKNRAGSPTYGYWLGFALKAPTDATQIKVAMGKATDTLTLGSTLDPLTEVTANGDLSAAFYADAGAGADARTQVLLQWFDENNDPVSEELTYNMVLPTALVKPHTANVPVDGVLSTLLWKAQGDDPYTLARIRVTTGAPGTVVTASATLNSSSTIVWKEKYTFEDAANYSFYWSLHDLSSLPKDANGCTPIGAAAGSVEQNNRYIIPENSVIHFTISATKDGKTFEYKFDHTMSSSDVTAVTINP